MPTDARNKKNEINRKFVFDYLMTHPCVDCGNSDIRVLQFDHLRDKKAEVTNMQNRYSMKTLIEEIAKCEIVCCNCHQIRTLTRSNSPRIGYYEKNRNSSN